VHDHVLGVDSQTDGQAQDVGVVVHVTRLGILFIKDVDLLRSEYNFALLLEHEDHLDLDFY
jgi:hypothetical protein